jgi:hypothetical protein
MALNDKYKPAAKAKTKLNNKISSTNSAILYSSFNKDNQITNLP